MVPRHVYQNQRTHLKGRYKLLQRDIEKLPFEAIEDRDQTECTYIKQNVMPEYSNYNGTPIDKFTKEEFEWQMRLGRER